MKRVIVGEGRQQITLLPDCLDDYVTADNSVRLVEVLIDELDLTRSASRAPYRRHFRTETFWKYHLWRTSIHLKINVITL